MLKKKWSYQTKKMVVISLLAFSFMGAYATLGDGKKKSSTTKKTILSNKTDVKPGSFSLKSGYNYRGSNVFSPAKENKTIHLNTVVTVQKGKTTFTIPLKKNVVLNRLKIDIGNRQFRSN